MLSGSLTNFCQCEISVNNSMNMPVSKFRTVAQVARQVAIVAAGISGGKSSSECRWRRKLDIWSAIEAGFGLSFRAALKKSKGSSEVRKCSNALFKICDSVGTLYCIQFLALSA